MQRPFRSSRPVLRTALRGAVVLGTGLAVAVVPLAAAGSATATTPTTVKTCTTGALPPVLKGKPASFKAGLAAGAWVWQDGKGWHLRVTHHSKAKLTFTGSVTTSGHIAAHRVLAESNDVLWRNNARTAVRFTLRNYGGVDGIDFTVGCAKTVTISLHAGKSKLKTAQIHLGKAAASPTSNPVVITRS